MTTAKEKLTEIMENECIPVTIDDESKYTYKYKDSTKVLMTEEYNGTTLYRRALSSYESYPYIRFVTPMELAKQNGHTVIMAQLLNMETAKTILLMYYNKGIAKEKTKAELLTELTRIMPLLEDSGHELVNSEEKISNMKRQIEAMRSDLIRTKWDVNEKKRKYNSLKNEYDRVIELLGTALKKEDEERIKKNKKAHMYYGELLRLIGTHTGTN